MLKTKNKPVKDKTYYIGYKVRFDTVNSGSSSTIVFQWKNYASSGEAQDNVPASLRLHKGNTLAFNVNPNFGTQTKESNVWTTKIELKKTYRFGIVVNTASKGFVQLYCNGKLVSMLDPSFGKQTTKLAGNYFSGGKTGAASPKVGLYGTDNVAMDSYIYDVKVGTSLSDIKSVAGIA